MLGQQFLDNLAIIAIVRGQPVVCFVENSRVKYGGKMQHLVRLNSPIFISTEETIFKAIVSEENVLAVV